MTEHYPQEELMRFARLLAEGKHSFVAASEITNDTSEALAYHEVWKRDSRVIAEVARLKEECGVDELQMSKTQFLEKIMEMADRARDDKAKASLLSLYAEIRGFIGKNALVQVNNVTNKVMVVQSKGSDEDWGAKLRKHQMKAISA